MWLIFVRIRMPELVDLGSEIDIRWPIRILSFIVILESVRDSDRFQNTLDSPRSPKAIVYMNQYILPVSIPYA